MPLGNCRNGQLPGVQRRFIALPFRPYGSAHARWCGSPLTEVARLARHPQSPEPQLVWSRDERADVDEVVDAIGNPGERSR